MTTAFLFLSHGTRDADGTREFVQFAALAAQEIRAQFGARGHRDALHFSHAFLELQSPDLPTAARTCAERGVTRIVLVPLLLFAAGHFKADLPRLLQEAESAGVDVAWQVTEPIGVDDAFIDVAVERIGSCHTWPAALAAPRSGPARDWIAALSAAASALVETKPQVPALLFVGRGGSDRDARRDALEVADAIAKRAGVGAFESAFLAGSGPTLAEGVERLISSPSRPNRLIALPYLWFSGLLTRRLPAQLASLCPPHVSVQTAPHLGLHPLAVRRVAARAIAAWRLFPASCDAISARVSLAVANRAGMRDDRSGDEGGCEG